MVQTPPSGPHTPPRDVLAQLHALDLAPDRPLLMVDCDEVLVSLADHLGAYAAAQGFRLEITEYKLEGALKRGDGTVADAGEFRTLFTGFFETETIRQRVYPGAADALASLARHIQIVVLTNVPLAYREIRVENLRSQGIDYPLVANRGPKGAAASWMAARVAAPAAFIDDSPTQLASVAEHAPEVIRLHHLGDTRLRALLGPVEAAHYSPQSWEEIEGTVRRAFGIAVGCATPLRNRSATST